MKMTLAEFQKITSYLMAELVEDTERKYVSSANAGNYSPSSPWNAPGMSVNDFI